MAVLSSSWCRVDVGLDYGTAFNLSISLPVLAGIWLGLCNSRLKPGVPRLIAALPCVIGNLIIPKLFCRGVDSTTLVLATFNTLWLSTFKALAWALDRGPLADSTLTFPQFVAVYMAPLTPKQQHGETKSKKGQLSEHAGGARELFMAMLAKSMMVWSFTALLLSWPTMPGVLRSLLLTLGLYALLSSIMDGPAVMLTGLLGLQLSPHFNQPWLSHSISSFWNKRWDLAAGNTLRTLIYDPIVEGRLVHDPTVAPALNNPWRQLAGVSASFIMSGLVHEVIYWYMLGRHTPHFLWLAYFSLQAPLIAIERVVRHAFKRRGWRLPNLLRILITLGVQTLLGHWMFWAPMMGEPSERILSNIIASWRAHLEAAGVPLTGVLNKA